MTEGSTGKLYNHIVMNINQIRKAKLDTSDM